MDLWPDPWSRRAPLLSWCSNASVWQGQLHSYDKAHQYAPLHSTPKAPYALLSPTRSAQAIKDTQNEHVNDLCLREDFQTLNRLQFNFETQNYHMSGRYSCDMKNVTKIELIFCCHIHLSDVLFERFITSLCILPNTLNLDSSSA